MYISDKRTHMLSYIYIFMIPYFYLEVCVVIGKSLAHILVQVCMNLCAVGHPPKH